MVEEKQINEEQRNNEGRINTENLESKTDFMDRLKYAAVPLALTCGAYFTPEIRARYGSLSTETQNKYKNLFLTGAVLLGTLTAASSGYALFKNYQKKKVSTASVDVGAVESA